ALFPEAPSAHADSLTDEVTEFAADLWHGLVPMAKVLGRAPLPGFARFRRSGKATHAFVREGIRRRLPGRDGEPPPGLLTDMLATRDRDGQGMTAAAAHDEVLTLLLAGRGTITSALGWTWHLMARHPEVEWAVQREVDALPAGGPRASDLARLGY